MLGNVYTLAVTNVLMLLDCYTNCFFAKIRKEKHSSPCVTAILTARTLITMDTVVVAEAESRVTRSLRQRFLEKAVSIS